MDLGVVVQGQSAKLSSRIKNQSTNPVQVSKIESSCECLEVRFSRTRISPGESVLAHAHYDGVREPEFVGALQIEVQLIDDKGTKVGQIDVPIAVRAGEKGAAFGTPRPAKDIEFFMCLAGNFETTYDSCR